VIGLGFIARALGRFVPAAMVATVVMSHGCGEAADMPRPMMPVKVTVEPHIPDTLDLGVHLRLKSLSDETITVSVEIESDSLSNSPESEDLSIHPIFRGDGPVEITIEPGAEVDFWFTRGQLSPEDPIIVTHRTYAAQLVRVPVDATKGPVEAIAIGPVE